MVCVKSTKCEGDTVKLIVGLGNPGQEYEKTRHNIGFMIIDNYLAKKGIINKKNKFDGEYAEIKSDNEKIILLKPLKYINLSGEVIKKYISFYKISIEDILIIHDDLDLVCGTYKLRYKGSSGGHNGLKNIEKEIGTNEYKRLRVGISNNKEINTVDYVLGKLKQDEIEKIKTVINISEAIIDDFLKLSFTNLMNKYNHK